MTIIIIISSVNGTLARRSGATRSSRASEEPFGALFLFPQSKTSRRNIIADDDCHLADRPAAPPVETLEMESFHRFAPLGSLPLDATDSLLSAASVTRPTMNGHYSGSGRAWPRGPTLLFQSIFSARSLDGPS